MKQISAVLIVKNEEEMLARCLDSLRGVDEIIIVDTGSEDNTIEIAKKYTPNVFSDYTWADNFAEARNHALAKATKDYVLSIDADEVLHDFAEVRKVIEKAEEGGHLAIDVKLYAEHDNQMHCFPRLFKRDPKVSWAGAVHNHLNQPATLSSDIGITYGYSPAHLKDPNRAMRILQKEVERTKNPREIYYLGREFWYRRMYPDCVQLMGEYVQKAHFLAEKADAFLIMSKSYLYMGDWDSARDSCVQALIINPHFKEAVLHMAHLAGKGSGNPIWEKNALQWEKMAETADNSSVLFVR
jgi:glycosyltransferase involved in cell wall biosynthesis